MNRGQKIMEEGPLQGWQERIEIKTEGFMLHQMSLWERIEF